MENGKNLESFSNPAFCKTTSGQEQVILGPDNQYLHQQDTFNVSQLSASTHSFNTVAVPDATHNENTPPIPTNHGDFQECGATLDCVDDWSNSSEVFSVLQGDVGLVNQGRHASSATYFSLNDLTITDLNRNSSNNNNNNSNVLHESQLPSLSTFSRTHQSSSATSTLDYSSASSLPPSISPFSNISLSHGFNNTLEPTNSWLNESPEETLSIGGPSPFNSPQKKQLNPIYVNHAAYVSSSTLRLQI